MRNKHNRVSNPNDFISHPGSRYHTLYESKLNDDGTISLRPSGRKDIQAEIDSHLMETDMAVIISKLQFGDTSVLSRKTPMYGDFTRFPKTYAEAFELVSRSEKAFESLSPDVKQKFDNDVSKWFASIGTPDWLQLMGLVSPSSSESEVSE